MKSGATVEGLEELLFLGFHWVRAGLGKEEVKPPPPALTVERNGRHLQSRPLREEVGKDRRTEGQLGSCSRLTSRDQGSWFLLGKERVAGSMAIIKSWTPQDCNMSSVPAETPPK